MCSSGFLCSVSGTRSAAADVALQDGVLLKVRTVFVVNSVTIRTLTDGIDSKLAGAVDATWKAIVLATERPKSPEILAERDWKSAGQSKLPVKR